MDVLGQEALCRHPASLLVCSSQPLLAQGLHSTPTVTDAAVADTAANITAVTVFRSPLQPTASLPSKHHTRADKDPVS